MSGRTYIAGVGSYLPPRSVTNRELPPPLCDDPEGVTRRTGIEARRWADAGVYTSDLAAEAGRAALADAGLEPADIDCLMTATCSPDHHFPGLGCYAQPKLGMTDIPAYDIRAQCSGFLYSLNVARAFIETGTYERILLICAELQSHCLGEGERHAGITALFADGAAAVVVCGEQGAEPRRISVDHIRVHCDGSGADRLRMRIWDISLVPYMDWQQIAESSDEIWCGEMDGTYIFRRAATYMARVARDALDDIGLSMEDIDWLLPHQANQNITRTVGSLLKMPTERVLSNIHRVGNTTAASIPVLLDEAIRDGSIESGQRILAVVFGAGITWGAALFTA